MICIICSYLFYEINFFYSTTHIYYKYIKKENTYTFESIQKEVSHQRYNGSKYKEQWYKDKYPSNVQGDVITCSTCEVNSLDVRPLKNEMFQREIYCTECGKTLYYFSL